MLYLIEPLPVGDDNLVAGNVPEDDYPVFNRIQAYVTGERVVVRDTHKVYEARADVLSPVSPQNNLFNAETNPAGQWVEVGATRRWKPFDGSISDILRSRGLPEMAWHIFPGTRADSLAFFGLQASTVRVRVVERATGTVTFDVTQSGIDPANITDAWDFFVNPPAYHSEMVFRGLPITATTEVRITITGGGVESRVGEIVVGREVEIGTLLLGGGVGMNDYSRKERDDFGNATIVRRAYSDIATYPVAVTAGRERYVLRTLANLRSIPAVFHAGQDMTSRGLTVYGFFRDVPVTLSGPTHSQLNIEVEGLT